MKRLATALVLTAALVVSCGGSDGAETAGNAASTAPGTESDPVASSAVESAPSGTEASTNEAGTAAAEPSEPSETPDRSSTAAVEFPLTIEHLYGSTTFEEPPQRIVSLDTQWTDVLVALDAPLAAAALDPYTDDGTYPWQDTIPADVERIPVEDGSIPYEAIAALDPDLIVITYYATSEADYTLLSEIAPTIPLLGDKEVDAWQDIAAVAGQLIGDPEAAAALVADVDQLSADLRAELPGLEGTTYAFANYVPGDSIYVVADPDDGAGILFGQLGMEIDPELLAIADGNVGRVQLSLEQIGQLDADVLIMLTNDADPADIPGYDALPAVQSGAVAILDMPDITGLNTPTPLSIPYSLAKIRAALEASTAS